MKYTVDKVKECLCKSIDHTTEYFGKHEVPGLDKDATEKKYAEWKDRINSPEFDDLSLEKIEEFSGFHREVRELIREARLAKYRLKKATSFEGAEFDGEEDYDEDICLNSDDIYVKERNEWFQCPLTFWDIVEKLDWKNNTENLHKLRWELFNICGMSTVAFREIQEIFCDYVRALKNSIVEYDLKINGRRHSDKFFKGSDDSFDDFCCHIVGMGEAAYKTCMVDPGASVAFMDSYVESFRYVFRMPEFVEDIWD